MTTLQRLRILALGCGLAACASTPHGARGGACLVTLHNYKNGQRFELASESHTSRVEYYSQARGDAVRKVQTDDVMAALVDELERQGLQEHGQRGRAPTIGSGAVIRWGFELERGGESSHWLIGPGSSSADWQAFQQCRDTFLQFYNTTVSFQTVNNESGKKLFEDEQPRAAPERKR